MFDKHRLLAFLEEGLGPSKRETAARHCRAILASALKDAESGRPLDLSEARLPNIPKWAREGIPQRFSLMTTTVAPEDCLTSRDGSTTKMIVELQDGHRVEAVVMRHDKGRVTLCVSSQVGCKMGCTFCATGTLGELGNLTCGEILEQLVHAQRLFAPGSAATKKPTTLVGKNVGDHEAEAEAEAEADDEVGATTTTGRGAGVAHAPAPTHVSGTGKGVGVRNVVFMGMGEPLNNYDSVVAALGPMTDPQCFALAPSRCTVSTVGVIPKMKRLVEEVPGVCLALSLHAPNQTLREKIVPTATAYKLPALMDALDYYLASGPRVKTMVEYCVLGGVNDTEACAVELAELMHGKDIIVNLIPYNPTDVPMGHVPPDPEAVKAMTRVLTGRGVFTTVRHEMGQDIAGACGQLALKKGPSSTPRANNNGGGDGDIEDLAGPTRRMTAGASGGGGGGGAALRSRAKASRGNPSDRARAAASVRPASEVGSGLSETSEEGRNGNKVKVSAKELEDTARDLDNKDNKKAAMNTTTTTTITLPPPPPKRRQSLMYLYIAEVLLWGAATLSLMILVGALAWKHAFHVGGGD